MKQAIHIVQDLYKLIFINKYLKSILYINSKKMASFINYLFNKILELPIIYNLGYKAFYLYSYCQIIANKYSLTNLFNIKNKINSEIKLYKNGTLSTNIDYDLAIYNTINVNNKNIYITISDINYNTNSYYTLTNYQFVSMSINYLGDEYEINLSNPKYTYYIVNNKLDKAFIAYYLTNYCKVDLSLDKDKKFTYSGIILDDNMNVVSITENDIIELYYDKYLIKNVGTK